MTTLSLDTLALVHGGQQQELPTWFDEGASKQMFGAMKPIDGDKVRGFTAEDGQMWTCSFIDKPQCVVIPPIK